MANAQERPGKVHSPLDFFLPDDLQPTTTAGILSRAPFRTTNGTTSGHVLQTNAAINGGNSGGPLLDAQARVLGINTYKATDSEGLNYAIAFASLAEETDRVIRRHQRG